MWHQFQIPIYLAKVCAGPVADTAVACLAILCFLTLKHSWNGIEYKRPIAATAASFANVALLLSTTDSLSARSVASVAAALALFMCSAASLSQGNLQACLHIVRVLNTAFNPSLLPLHVAAASSLIHLLAAWQLLNAGTKAHVVRCLYDMLGIRGLSLVKLGKRRPLTIEDIRDPAAEEEFIQKCKHFSNDCSKRTTVTALLLMEWRTTVYIMAIDTIIQLTSRSRQLVFIAILSAASRSDQVPNVLELGTLFVVWQLLVLISPAWRHFSTLQTDFKKRKRALITGKIQAIYAFSRRETVSLWRSQHSADELVDISESFMSIISAALAEILNAWVTASRIGWRALVPIIVASIHLFISRLVTKKIQRLRDENRVDIAPKFQYDFTSMLHNIRTVKFYAWEDVFSKGQLSARPKEYEPPMVWRVLEFSLNLISHTTAEVCCRWDQQRPSGVGSTRTANSQCGRG